MVMACIKVRFCSRPLGPDKKKYESGDRPRQCHYLEYFNNLLFECLRVGISEPSPILRPIR